MYSDRRRVSNKVNDLIYKNGLIKCFNNRIINFCFRWCQRERAVAIEYLVEN